MYRSTLATLLAILLSMAACNQRRGGIDIWSAIENEDVAGIETFASSGGDVNLLNHDGSTPLWVALTERKRQSYESLLEHGADPNIVMTGKRVVTHWAAMERDAWWLTLALEHGADPNLVNIGRGRPSEGPPLKAAISNGTLENVELLVDYGADVNKADSFDCYPVASAMGKNNFDMVLYLLDHGADYQRAKCGGISFLSDMHYKWENRNRLFLLQADRDGIAAVRAWFDAQGIEIAPD